jgi:galactokinase/mevalonate kinase-like predicted kinase
MYQLVGEAEKILTDKHSDLDEFGRMLDHTWRLKRQIGAKVSTDTIDGLYEKGIKAGALGGKLLGAGALFKLKEQLTEDFLLLNADAITAIPMIVDC